MEEPTPSASEPRTEGDAGKPGARAAGPAAGRSPVRGSLPAVVASDRAEVQRAEARRARRKALPSFGVAALVHVAVLVWLHQIIIEPALEDQDRTIQADYVTEDTIEPEDTSPPEELLEPPPEPDADVVLIDTPQVAREDVPPSDVLGLGGSGGSGGSGSSIATAGIEGVRPAAFSGASAGTPFHRFVDDMRSRGLDVVFVVDATGSMQRFIDRAQETIGRIIGDLSAVVPSLRLGIVAYRDLQDTWITRVKDLSDDRYAVHGFLLDLEAAGGKRVTPDFEEAVEVGLATAAETLAWRPGARRVIILVGDAPYHDEDKSAALATVRAFARDEHSLVNTIYVGAGDASRATDNQTRARDALELIARTGGGKAFELVADDPDADELLRERVSEATFGAEWKDEVVAFLERVPRDPLLGSVERHVGAADRKWLVRRLEDETIHPGVVDGAIALFDASLASACLKIVSDESRPPAARSACFYVLKRAMESLAGMSLDTHRPLAEQQEELATLRRRVDALKPKGLIAAPPPTPPQGG